MILRFCLLLTILAGISGAFISGAFAQAESSKDSAFWPGAHLWRIEWKATGIDTTEANWILGDDNSLAIRDDAPVGNYALEWEIARPAGVGAVVVTAQMRKHNLNQTNHLLASDDGITWSPLGGNDKDWTWQDISGVFWQTPANSKQPLRLRWAFNHPGQEPIWQVALRNVQVRAATAQEVANALREFQRPLAEGLPPLPDPRQARKPWTSKLKLINGLILKDDQPFFPIGYVFGTDERGLAQAQAMGCNAVHFELAWNLSQVPGAIPASQFEPTLSTIRNAARWGMVTFPLLTGHYIPGWFAAAHPPAAAAPIGSDGQPTGSWFPYSLHYPPFRDAIPNFWRSAAPLLNKEPNVMAVNFWNEPAYGGSWNRGDQFADYSTWGIADYRAHLQKKYGNLPNLQKAHGRDYASFEAVQPPRTPEEMGRVAWLDWMEYGQHFFAEFFGQERAILQTAAPGLRVANKKQTNPWDNSTASSGTNWHLLGESEDIFGLNAYIGSEFGARNIMEGARSYAGGKPVVVFETNVMPPNALARTPDRVRVQFWSQVLGGARGIFIFALMGDSPDHGLLDDRAVSPTARREYVRFTQTVANHQRELAAPRVASRIAVLYSTTAALQTTQNIVPSNVMGAYDLLRNSHYQVDILPEERCTPDVLSSYRLLVVPSHSILKAPALAAVNTWLERGGKAIVFGNSLTTDEYFNSIKPPQWMGIESRQSPIGERTEQKISSVAAELQPFLNEEITISDVELVSQLNAAQSLLPGAGIQTAQAGQVLAYNSDSYPTILLSPKRNVVYCAFAPRYSEGLRGLVEGVTRQTLGLKQEVRLTDDDIVESQVMVSMNQDYQNPKRRYLLALNTLQRPRTVQVELEPGWKIVRERFHNLPIKDNSIRLEKREVYLFDLERG